MKNLDEILHRRIQWNATGDPGIPLSAEYDGSTLRVRVNDFPTEPLYTVLVDDVEVGDLEEWPRLWEHGCAA